MRRLFALGLIALVVGLTTAPALARGPRVRVAVGPANSLQGDRVELSGTTRDVPPGTAVRLTERVDGRWRWLGEATIRNGAFSTTFVPRAPGPGVVRARVAETKRSPALLTFAVFTVFRPVEVTWYGPGFFGNSTACGQLYNEQILGVAHRTLPCGTPVTFFHNGILLTVPVIDRGPYSSAEWDLSAETARRLGFSGREIIGVLLAFEPRP